MAERLAEWVEKNLSEVRNLTRKGVVSPNLLNSFDIFVYYSGLKNQGKMQRYQTTADSMKVNLRTVIRAVKSMERTL